MKKWYRALTYGAVIPALLANDNPIVKSDASQNSTVGEWGTEGKVPKL